MGGLGRPLAGVRLVGEGVPFWFFYYFYLYLPPLFLSRNEWIEKRTNEMSEWINESMNAVTIDRVEVRGSWRNGM